MQFLAQPKKKKLSLNRETLIQLDKVEINQQNAQGSGSCCQVCGSNGQTQTPLCTKNN